MEASKFAKRTFAVTTGLAVVAVVVAVFFLGRPSAKPRETHAGKPEPAAAESKPTKGSAAWPFWSDNDEEEESPVSPDAGGGDLLSPECIECQKASEDCAPLVNGCDKVEGSAAAGPAAGTSRKALCEEAFDCAQRTNCGMVQPHHCYCGTARIEDCVFKGKAEGPCKAELERALETNDPKAIASTYMNPDLGGGIAMRRVTCAHRLCNKACF
jgi:hypothetical protein